MYHNNDDNDDDDDDDDGPQRMQRNHALRTGGQKELYCIGKKRTFRLK